MEELEQKMASILSDPDMMQKLGDMAHSLGLSGNEAPDGASALSGLNLSMLGNLTQQSSIDANQQSLLQALNPYISRKHIGKLEKAMRAAKMAKLASVFLGQNGLLSNAGR